jgi:hypothetical protein
VSCFSLPSSCDGAYPTDQPADNPRLCVHSFKRCPASFLESPEEFATGAVSADMSQPRSRGPQWRISSHFQTIDLSMAARRNLLDHESESDGEG